jgi:uncharacterized membrane protein YraQ (UPF0718 family)
MFEFVKTIAFDFWATTLEMSPYLLFGFFMAGLLSILISPQIVERHLGGRGGWPVVKASLFGVPLPLCSCGVIPVTISLHKHGASRASAISFLLSTPQTGIDSILVTYSLLGLVFAIFRPIAAFITGIIGGLFVDLFDKADPQNSNNKNNTCTDECCRHAPPVKKIFNAFLYGFITLPRDIAGALLVGLVIAAFITALVPDDFFAEILPSGFLAMLVMLALGIPVYVCASASVPIAAAMMLKGLSPGAAFVFLVTGPATNAASILTIWKVLGRKTAIIYLLTVVVCALAGGLLLNLLISGRPALALHNHGEMLPVYVKYVSAILLFLVLGLAVLRQKKSAEQTT